MVTAYDFIDFQIDLNIGGDAFFQYSSLEIPEYDIDRNHFAWAVTPWAWLRPAMRVHLGAFSTRNWLRRISAEFSAVIALGSPLFIDERMRLEASVLWRL